jgi:uncharacterized membrane protein
MDLDHVVPMVLGVFRALGIDPVELLAAGMVSFFIGFIVKPLARELDILRVKASSSENPVIKGSAAPLLNSLSQQLSELHEEDPKIKSLASMIASGVVAAAGNRREAKAISATLMKQLEKEIKDQIMTAGKAERDSMNKKALEALSISSIDVSESELVEAKPTGSKSIEIAQIVSKWFKKK